MSRIVFSRRAERDLRRIGRGEALARLREALEGLVVGESKPGDSDARFLVARVVHRRDLERAVATLE